MSFDIGSVIAKIDADVSGFKKGINEAKAETSNFKEGLGQISGKLQDFANTAATTMTVATAAISAFALKTAFSASRIDELTLALHAQAKANKITTAEVDKSVQAIRNNNISYEKALEVASNFITAELKMADAVKLSTVAKDLGIVASVGSSDATEMLTHAIVTGQTQQLAQFGILTTQTRAYGDYAESIHKASEDLTQAEKQQALLNVVFKQGEKVVGTYDAAMQSAGKQFRSFTSRILPDFLVLIGRAFEPTLLLGVNAISGAVKDMSKWLTQNEAVVRQWGQNFATIIKDVALIFSGDVGKQIDALYSLYAVFGMAPDDAVNQLTTSIRDFITNLGALGAWVTANREILITFLTSFGMALGTMFVLGEIALLITALLNPITWLIAGLTLLYAAWQTNFFGFRDITLAVVNEVILFFNNILLPALRAFGVQFQIFWTQNKDFLQAIWKVIFGIIELAWGLIYGLLSVGLALLTGDWKRAHDGMHHATEIAWNAIKNIFSGALNFMAAWGRDVYNKLVQPFVDAWNRIQDLVNKIKDALDFTKRHSPSVIDIVTMGVNKVNDILGDLAWNGTINANSAGAAVSRGGDMMSNLIVQIDMAGAFIADGYGANQMAELMGDAIIKRVQNTIRV